MGIIRRMFGDALLNLNSSGGKDGSGNIVVCLSDSQGNIIDPSTSSAQSGSSIAVPGVAQDSSLQQILSAVKATVNLSGTVWYDPTVNPPIFYVRTETINEGTGTITVSWQTPGGTSASPTVTNLVAVSYAQNISSNTVTYGATSNGSGYASGDILIHAYGIDTATIPATIAYSFWMNAGPSVASGSVLGTAPTAGTYSQTATPISVTNLPLPTNAAQETGGNLSAILAKLSANLSVNDAGTAITAAAMPSGGVGLTGWLSAAWYVLSQIYTKLSSSIAVTGTFWQATQPISAAALPLPTGAAVASLQPSINVDGGSLQHVTNFPSTFGLNGLLPAFAATPTVNFGTLNGAATDTSVLAVKTSLGTPFQAGGLIGNTTFAATQSGPWSVTANAGTNLNTSALALETGGNLASAATVLGTTADVAYTGTGSGTHTSLLKWIGAKLASTLIVSGNVNVTDTGTAITGANMPTGGAGITGWQSAIWTSLGSIYTKLNASIAVTGTFWQATQPISAASLPLPTGAATSANQATINADGGAQSHVMNFPSTQVVSGTVTLGAGSSTVGNFNQTLATAGLSRLTDGTSTVAVKAASTAAAATDPSLVVALSPNTPLPPGSNAVGTVGITALPATTVKVAQTPTVTATTYALGKVLGGIMTFASILPATSFAGLLESITIKFKGSVQTGGFYVAVFSTSPTGTFTDSNTAVIASTDSALLVGLYHLVSPNSPLGTHTIYNLDGIAKAFTGSSTSLYAVVVPDATTVALASASDMIVELAVMQG